MTDQLVIDSRHADAVLTMVAEDPDLRPGPACADADLRLTLVTGLGDLPKYAERVKPRYRNELAALYGESVADIDVLLMDLRTRFGAEAGHVPQMDSNGQTVFGLPQHKGVYPPAPLDRAPEPPSGVRPGDGDNVTVGVVDTPLYRHEAFDGHTVITNERVDIVNGTFVAWEGHATFVAGMILKYAPAATLDVRAGLDGTTGTKTVWAVALKIAALGRPDLVNLSLGVASTDAGPPLALRRALDHLGDGVLVVAAAGNRPYLPPNARIWPAADTDVVAVGSTHGDFSMRRPWVDLVAPGLDVTSTYLPGDTVVGHETLTFAKPYATWRGTSFAAATVSGLLAALMSRNPGMTAREAVAVLPDQPDSIVHRYRA